MNTYTTTILIYNARNPLNNCCISVAGDLKAKLAMIHRSATKKFTPQSLAQALGGKPADARRVRGTIKITGWSSYLTLPGENDTLYRVGPETKPGINYIKDFRTRPAPFLRDGSCRG